MHGAFRGVVRHHCVRRRGHILSSFAQVRDHSDAGLVALFGEVMHELHRRGVIHSGNNPIADMAERVVADYFRVDRELPNTRLVEAVLIPVGIAREYARRSKAWSAHSLSLTNRFVADPRVTRISAHVLVQE